MNIEKVLSFCIFSTLLFTDCLGTEKKTLPTIWKPTHADMSKSSMCRAPVKPQVQLTDPIATAKFTQKIVGQKKPQISAHLTQARRKSQIPVSSSSRQSSHLPPIHQPVTVPDTQTRSPRVVKITKQPTSRLNLSEQLKPCERYYPNKSGNLIDSLFPYKEGEAIPGGTEWYCEDVCIDDEIELIKYHAHNASKGVFLSVFSLKSNQNIVCLDYENSSHRGGIPGCLSKELCESTDLRKENDLWIPLEIMQELYPDMNFKK